MRPAHYSREIAQRCQALIRHLQPIVEGGLPDDAMFGGTLGTTFLLAMATPMIVLPIERIQVAGYNSSQVGNDRDIDHALTKKMSAVLDGKCKFSDAPFGAGGKWSYVTSYAPVFNLADGCPDDLLTALGTKESAARANDAPADEIMHVLRNALAHGGVAYLDKDGRSTERDAAMLAFIATERDKHRRVTGLNVLRIGQSDFHSFLMAWTDWLIH
jgi:hypothetical protein